MPVGSGLTRCLIEDHREPSDVKLKLFSPIHSIRISQKEIFMKYNVTPTLPGHIPVTYSQQFG